jgi:hypothetical protein
MKALTGVAALVAAGLLMVGCGGDTKTTTVATTAPTLPVRPAAAADPTEALVAVLETNKRDPNFHTTGFRTSGLVTDGFIKKIDQIGADAKASGGFIDFDPFVCAQQIPQSIKYSPGPINGDSATVVAHLKFGPSVEDVSYQLKRVAGDWLLDTDDCIEQALSSG